jgi:ribosomal protein S18 acetylase RimI-like enzyme
MKSDAAGIKAWLCQRMGCLFALNTIEQCTMLVIRDYDEKTHSRGVRACVVELQDFERTLNPRVPSGSEIVDDYMPLLLERCKKCSGKIIVATLKDSVVGFATVLTRVKSEEIEEGDIEYGLVYDLVVSSEFRARGIGRKLLEAAEAYAKSSEVRWLRIGVLAANNSAASLYDTLGFKPFYIEREKDLAGTS